MLDTKKCSIMIKARVDISVKSNSNLNCNSSKSVHIV